MQQPLPRQLSEAEIAYLFSFCKKHCVHHYDLQTELVDHLASAIEDMWRTSPAIPVEEAVVLVHKRFGVMGFATVVSERTEQLNRQHKKLRFQHFKQYFQWPKLALTGLIFAIMYSIGFALPQSFIPNYLVGLIVGVFLFELWTMISLWRLRRQQVQKLLLTETLAGSTILSFLAVQVLVHDELWNTAQLYAGSLVYNMLVGWLLLFVVGFLSYADFVKSIHRLARETYPEAFKKSAFA